jgi:L-lactate dehydrogenase complex protein LldF
MTDVFHTQIRTALANPGLQAALDANAERRLSARTQSFASLPEDLQTMRSRAHAVRQNTIANLDRYLEQFITKVQANGTTVHRAQDAAQAVQIVLEIARQNGVHLVAKSKTMVGEEIEINHALESEGIEVVETDLGEYIVQLRHERPAHIITPAVHLRRSDVGRTFQEKLGIPYTEEVPTLTSVARRVLRQTFLNADLGISGVNFGVAETGSLCVVTNEGNGRMISTLPPVHIALMGMERLVPTLDDLALMLALLPRSATGQKLTVYTNLINGPRRPGEMDGPLQRHLVIVDNGRSALRASPLSEALFCIRCGACLNACPVFREIGGHAYVGVKGEGSPYSGPIGSIVSPALFGQAEFGQLARASSLCGACKEACPVDIDLPKLLLRVRAGGVEMNAPAPARSAPSALAAALRIYGWFIATPGRFSFAQWMAGVFGRLAAPFSKWLRLPAFTGWGYSRDFPRPATQTFRTRWEKGEIGVSARPTSQAQAQIDPSPDRKLPAESALHANASQTGNSQAQSIETDALVERFAQELRDLGGGFERCEIGALTGQLLAFLKERQAETIQAWDAGQLPDGLLEALQQAGIRVCNEPDPEVRVGLTGAPAALADTGSLVLPAGSGRPLSTSLLPEVHIALLRPEAIYPSLAQSFDDPAFASLRQPGKASSVVLITGPSRTADIEMTLTIGVHGPGEVQVFCVDGW